MATVAQNTYTHETIFGTPGPLPWKVPTADQLEYLRGQAQEHSELNFSQQFLSWTRAELDEAVAYVDTDLNRLYTFIDIGKGYPSLTELERISVAQSTTNIYASLVANVADLSGPTMDRVINSLDWFGATMELLPTPEQLRYTFTKISSEMAQVISQYIYDRQIIPVDTGRLRSSITVQNRTDGYVIGHNTEYALKVVHLSVGIPFLLNSWHRIYNTHISLLNAEVHMLIVNQDNQLNSLMESLDNARTTLINAALAPKPPGGY